MWINIVLSKDPFDPGLSNGCPRAEIQIHHSEIRRPMALHNFSLNKCHGFLVAPSGLGGNQVDPSLHLSDDDQDVWRVHRDGLLCCLKWRLSCYRYTGTKIARVVLVY